MTAPVPAGQDPANPANIAARYGFVGQMAYTVPEIKDLLDRATREQWTTDRFMSAVADTNWWKTHSQAAREWATLQATDPATYETRRGHLAGDVYWKSQRLGINMTWDQALAASDYIQTSGGMSDENIESFLYQSYFNPYSNWNELDGKAAGVAQQISDVGWSYGWRDYDHYQESRDELGKILRGEDSIEGFQIKMRAYAKSMYPGFNDQIEAGQTVREIAAPYIDRQAQLLEVAPTSIDLQDNLLNKALQARGSNGEPAPMAIWQHEQQVRADPRWSKTNNAKDSAAQFLEKVGKDWGMAA